MARGFDGEAGRDEEARRLGRVYDVEDGREARRMWCPSARERSLLIPVLGAAIELSHHFVRAQSCALAAVWALVDLQSALVRSPGRSPLIRRVVGLDVSVVTRDLAIMVHNDGAFRPWASFPPWVLKFLRRARRGKKRKRGSFRKLYNCRAGSGRGI